MVGFNLAANDKNWRIKDHRKFKENIQQDMIRSVKGLENHILK